MRVNVLTSRTGGPLRWGKDLTCALNNNGIEAKHFHTLPGLAICPLHQAADIVHTTIPLPFKIWRKPLILTMHGEYTIERNMWQRFYPKIMAQADAITVPSQFLKAKLDLPDAVVIPNALFPERFKVVRHRAKERVNLISVMNFHFLDKAEGVPAIVNILNKLQSYQVDYKVIGGGKYLNTVKNQVRGTNVNVKFTGFLSDPRPSLADSDIFLYYSHHDNFPTVILEAMATGLPVISNDIGAVAEIINHGYNGYIAENDDAYLTYLTKLMDSSELRQEIVSNARREVERKFNWSKLGFEYVKLYNKLVK